MTPSEREVWRWCRAASDRDLVERYRSEVNAPINRLEEIQHQRWLGLSILGEMFRRGVNIVV